ncbi:hypothetical protein AC1031_004925 [Aphanomyces cochlioides]|nr:hypothetical protein AC1031_004925 [Aphanomyces cochlioides]
MVQRQTIQSAPLSPLHSVEETKAAVDAVAAQQQLTYAQLKAFWDEHQALRRDTGSEFMMQRQIHEELREQLNEQRKVMMEHHELLRQAALAVNQQREEIVGLKETVHSPRGKARWGLFAEVDNDDEKMAADEESDTPHAFSGSMSATMFAAGNLTTPPIYKGCTKREKREFMDKYLSYQTRMQALAEASGRSIALTPAHLPKSHGENHGGRHITPVVKENHSMPKKGACLKCSSTEHKIFQCPKAKPEETKKLWPKLKKRRLVGEKKVVAAVAPVSTLATDMSGGKTGSENNGATCAIVTAIEKSNWIQAEIDGQSIRMSLDSGADYSVVSNSMLDILQQSHTSVKVLPLSCQQKLLSFANESMAVKHEAVFDLRIPTEYGDLVLKDVHAWISATDFPIGLGDLLVSREIMCKLG